MLGSSIINLDALQFQWEITKNIILLCSSFLKYACHQVMATPVFIDDYVPFQKICWQRPFFCPQIPETVPVFQEYFCFTLQSIQLWGQCTLSHWWQAQSLKLSWKKQKKQRIAIDQIKIKCSIKNLNQRSSRIVMQYSAPPASKLREE